MQTQFLGQVDYAPTLERMRAFTATRNAATPDALWLCEHPPVYTLGLAATREHLLAPGTIPVVASDRGGQVTYHGPGQVVVYTLVDLKRAGYYVKEFVYRLEQALLRSLAQFGVTGQRVRGAPGIYVNADNPFAHAALNLSAQQLGGTSPLVAKIAALGLKVHRHCCYHGLALNVQMDLSPFARINPCGYAGLATTDLSTIGVNASWDEVAQNLTEQLHISLTP